MVLSCMRMATWLPSALVTRRLILRITVHVQLLREYVNSILNEGFNDVIDVIIRIRVKIQGPGTRTLRDILTDIRGLVKVITVEQEGKISDRDIDGRAYAVLNIKFEDTEEYEVSDLLRDVSSINDIDMIRFIKIDDHRR